MVHFRSNRHRLAPTLRVVIALTLIWFAAGTSDALGASVTAVLSNSSTAVGEPVQLQIKVSGSASVKHPGTIAVDGLDIRFTGQSQLLEGRNFQFSYSYIYNYTVMPLKAGTFKIPPQTIDAGGESFRTPELSLQVADASAQSSRSNRSGGSIDPS